MHKLNLGQPINQNLDCVCTNGAMLKVDARLAIRRSRAVAPTFILCPKARAVFLTALLEMAMATESVDARAPAASHLTKMTGQRGRHLPERKRYQKYRGREPKRP